MTHSTPSPSSPLRIGFVGVGNLGAKLAASLVHAGFAVAVHDRDRAAAEGLLALGAVWGDSPAAVADGADTDITCLPSDRKSTRLNSSHVSESRMPSSA